ncbi:unnamed protein product [Adineta ricciae]|uniref:Uncharacterized protein n=1 Tax=Adineta ricciae TaxID=249248 RepID=A0A816ALF0_ADIRI|nr:unnamed protein product [Adineta ricciae]
MAKEIAQRMRKIRTAVETLNIRQYDPPNELAQQYGYMKFDELPLDSNARLSQYIRLQLDTNADVVVKFMLQGWGLPTPDLIISVTGGAKHCDMSARLRKIFQRGLVAAAVTTNAWLITAGTNAGVVKEVGQALNNYRYKNQKHGLDIPCIGIGSWGYTAEKEQLGDQPNQLTINGSSRSSRAILKNQQSGGVAAVRMDIGDQYCVRNYVVKEKQKKQCDLEANHSHFLLFDDGQPNADSVLPLRAEIEKRCRHINTDSAAEGVNELLIPIVMVLVEGGPSSIRTICQALESNTPVVVVKDSGRAADLVAELHACLCDNDINNATGYPTRPKTGAVRGESRDNEINAILTKAKADNSWIDEVKNELCRVLYERRHLVTIFKFDSKRHHGNLEDAILEALFTAAKFTGDQNEQHQRTAELKLAMAWHKFDYAKQYLLTDTTISKWKEDDLRRALVDALLRGHVDFVELLIEFGTSLEKITFGDLRFLYDSRTAGTRLPLRPNVKHYTNKRDRYYSTYFGTLWSMEARNRIPSKDEDLLGSNAPRDLFLWAVALDRVDLATYLCSKTWNSSIAPLFAAQMYRRAARFVIDSEAKQQYEKNANQFDLHATAIIDRCFDADEDFAVDLLKRPAHAFYNVKALELASKSDCRSFLASKSVQKYLDNEWFGYINYRRKAINFRIFFCSLFFPLLPIFCFSLPYVEKHKKVTRSSRDRTKVSQPLMIHNVIEPAEQKQKGFLAKLEKIGQFYHAPIVRFYYYMIFFVIFLALYSYVLLVDYFPLNQFNERRSGYSNLYIPITEIILHICIWCLIIEELRQVIFAKSKREYLAEIWNWIDIFAIILYIVGFITRFFMSETLFTVSKIFLCLDLILWYIRTLHLFAAYERLGPKLVMIFNTMRDLLFFICFIFIFLIGFSIASWALLTTSDQVTWNYDNSGTLVNATVQGGGSGIGSWQVIRNVINYGVWKVFGQVDPIDGTDAYSVIAFVLAILFLAIANVLLLNVLVALFNVTIQNVENQSHQLWRYQRFLIVCEYADKPPLPPPFNLFYYLYSSIRYIFEKCRSGCQSCRRRRNDQVSSETLTMTVLDSDGSEKDRELKITDAMQRESAIADDYWRYALTHGKQDEVHVALQNMERQLHELKERVLNNATSANMNNNTNTATQIIVSPQISSAIRLCYLYDRTMI